MIDEMKPGRLLAAMGEIEGVSADDINSLDAYIMRTLATRGVAPDVATLEPGPGDGSRPLGFFSQAAISAAQNACRHRGRESGPSEYRDPMADMMAAARMAEAVGLFPSHNGGSDGDPFSDIEGAAAVLKAAGFDSIQAACLDELTQHSLYGYAVTEAVSDDPVAEMSAAMDAVEAAGGMPNTLVMHPRFLAARAARAEAVSRREARHKHRLGNKLARRCAARLGW